MTQYTPDAKTLAQIHNNFRYHPPLPGQTERYEEIRAVGKHFALLLSADCPPSRELSVALTHVETAVMWANAAIARNERPDLEPVTTPTPIAPTEPPDSLQIALPGTESDVPAPWPVVPSL